MADPRRPHNGHQRLMGPPETPSRVMQASPGMFSTLQFSPDLFSPSNLGPATAPIYPQQKLFWDTSFGNMDMTGHVQQYQDPFAMARDDMSMSYMPHQNMVPPFQYNQPQVPEQPYDLPNMTRSMTTPYDNRTAFPAPFRTSPRMPPPLEDNPSMFLSSPARRFGTGEPAINQFANRSVRDRPAYHHQIEESRREQENKRARKGDSKHPSVTRSVMEALRRPVSPAKDQRPGLKRSLTHSGDGRQPPHNRQQSHLSSLETMSNASGSTRVSSRNGRRSPVKALGESIVRPLSSNTVNSAKRLSLALSIDENGVAKTVVKEASEDHLMDLDEESSDSGVSSRDESDLHHLHSQAGSFAIDDDSGLPSDIILTRMLGSRHSKTSSHSTMASNGSAWQSSRNSSATSAPNTKGSDHGRGAVRRKPLLDSMQEHDMNVENDSTSGDAQQALRAIIQDRSRPNVTQNDTNRNRQMSHFNSSPPIQHLSSAYNVSPTTITDPDLATPSTDRESFLSNSSTRCVCNSSTPESAATMIQCDSCTKWLHTGCVGIDSRRVPDVYVCVYCSQTPMRHGRVRGGGGGGGGGEHPSHNRISLNHPSASPLAHKSQRRRA